MSTKDALKIAIIDLDTSHPESFIPRLNEIEGVRLSGVFDRGRVRGREETLRICRSFACTAYASREETASETDAVMVLSADWETHVDDVRFFLERGVSVYCDKPLTGSMAELREFEAFLPGIPAGTVFLSGSGWRLNRKIRSAGREHAESRIDNVFMSAPNHDFYYGIHAVETVLGLCGCGLQSVVCERAGSGGSLFTLTHERGAVIRIMTGAPFSMRTLLYTADGLPRRVSFDTEDIHNAVCGGFVQLLRGDTGEDAETFSRGGDPAGTGAELRAPYFSEQSEALRALFAMQHAAETDQELCISDVPEKFSIPSRRFLEEYTAAYQKSKNHT
jgi:hypothetical protein